jgi:uncharacterized protein
MQCPVCQVPLQITDRQGVEIDYCPRCRGVWLDRGELDKIIERSEAYPTTAYPAMTRTQSPLPVRGVERYDHDDDHDDHYKRGHRKKRGFFGELFDFD